jgi:hypothetical protein
MPRKRVTEAEGVSADASSLAETTKKTRASRAKAPAKRASKSPPAAKKDETAPVSGPTQEEIAALAYQYWIQGGCRHGHDREDWERAERELKARYAAAR